MSDAADITWADLRGELPSSGLFRGTVPWLLSPRPFVLSKNHRRSLLSLGAVLVKFYDACGMLYRASHTGKAPAYVSGILDTGKPSELTGVKWQDMPRVIRPDLLLRDDPLWCLTELDSVPGGQGVTACLNGLYAEHGWQVLGGATGMQDAFRKAHPHGASILISQESVDYRAELELFASMLGDGYSCQDAEGAYIAPDELIYRFFELFDLQQISGAQEHVLRYLQSGKGMSPAPLAYMEEKMWLALFHQPGLQDYWVKLLRGSYLEMLRHIIPHSWIVDPAPLPDNAVLPWLNVHGWQQVMNMSQKERQLVLKISGFNEKAWGARGVFVGSDMPGAEWSSAVSLALSEFRDSPWIMQEFLPGSIVEHPYYDPQTGELRMMQGRARICPYYYRTPENEVILGGCLATIAPKDKKKIHGMNDAILVPCV